MKPKDEPKNLQGEGPPDDRLSPYSAAFTIVLTAVAVIVVGYAIVRWLF